MNTICKWIIRMRNSNSPILTNYKYISFVPTKRSPRHYFMNDAETGDPIGSLYLDEKNKIARANSKISQFEEMLNRSFKELGYSPRKSNDNL